MSRLDPTVVERVRTVRDRLLAAGAVTAAADGKTRELFPVAIGPREGRALHDRVRHEGATRTLECGLGFAISTLFICEALLENGVDGKHVAADPYQYFGLPAHRTTYVGVGLEILEKAGVRDLVEFFPEESQVVLPRLLTEGREFDLAFIDGNHRFEGVFLDLIYSGRLLHEGGIVFVDDVQLPDVRRAVDFCVSSLGWRIEEEGSEGAHGWCVLRSAGRDAFLRPYAKPTDS